MSALAAKDPGLRRLAPSFLPATAVLEMTYRCNHVCLFCSCPWFAREGGYPILRELCVAEWKCLIGTLCRMGVNNLAFTGGEPLLKEGLADIIAYASGCLTEHVETRDGRLVSFYAPPRLYLLTNGKALTDEVMEICARHGIHLSLSLPGLTAFPEHTGGEDPKFVLASFRKAKSMGVSSTVGITVTRKNLGELYETIAEALLAGADNLLMNRFLPGGRGLSHRKELALAPEEIARMLDIAEEVLRAANRRGSLGTELPKCLVDANKYERLRVGTRCSAALDFFVVDPSGYVRVCNHSPIRLNHIRDIERLKRHLYWRRFIMKDYLPQSCLGCALIGDCDGGCREAARIVGGSIKAPDPLLERAYTKLHSIEQ